MMNDCQNVEIRETLPELAHDALPARDAATVREHLEACTDCASELAIIQRVIAMRATPAIDVTRIVAAIPAYHKRSRFSAARMQLAAAALIGAVGISALVVRQHETQATSSSSVTAHAISTSSVATSGVALVGTADISDANLAQLINDLGNLDAVPPTEPEPVTPVALENGGGA